MSGHKQTIKPAFIFATTILSFILIGGASRRHPSLASTGPATNDRAAADVVVWEENFDAGIPDTWTVIDSVGSSLTWTGVISSGEKGNYTGGAGDAATASSDKFGAHSFDTELRSPSFDLPTGPSAFLEFRANYQALIHHDTLDVDISSDGGANWANLLHWNDDHGYFHAVPGEVVEVDISSYMGTSGLLLRWRYYDLRSDAWDWYAQIDDVRVVIRGVDLEMEKTVAPGLRVARGTAITYTLTYTNHGPSVARGVIVSDPLPDVFTTTHYASYGAAITLTGGISYTWQVADLPPGAGGIITVTGTLRDDLTGGLVFTNSAAITSTTAESAPGNNSGTAVASVVNAPPTVSALPDQVIYVGDRLGPLAFTVRDSDGPAERLTLTGASSNPALVPGDDVRFAGAGTQRTVTLTPTTGMTGTTVISITVSDGTDETSSAFQLTVVRYHVYLPLGLRGFVTAPDLVVKRLLVASDTVTVVVANQGHAPVTDEFWVDVYVDPDPVPSGVNQIWNALCTEGLVWGVTDGVQPGEAITLTVGGDYYRPEYSHFSGTLASGTPVYAQVDSANADTTYGAVLESHEITGGEYNNIAGPEFYVSNR